MPKSDAFANLTIADVSSDVEWPITKTIGGRRLDLNLTIEILMDYLDQSYAAAAHTHTLSDVTQSGAGTGQVPVWSGSAWVPGSVDTDAGTGDVTGPASAVNDRIAVYDGTTGKVLKDGGVSIAGLSVGDDTITNAKLANVATSTIKGRVTASTGDPEDLTAAQARTLLNVVDADAAQASLNLKANLASPTFTGTVTAPTIDMGNVDTTLTRASAGDIAIEGNIVYRAGGTDVPLTDGGTGAGTAAAARTNLGLGNIAEIVALEAEVTDFILGRPAGGPWTAYPSTDIIEATAFNYVAQTWGGYSEQGPARDAWDRSDTVLTPVAGVATWLWPLDPTTNEDPDPAVVLAQANRGGRATISVDSTTAVLSGGAYFLSIKFPIPVDAPIAEGVSVGLTVAFEVTNTDATVPIQLQFSAASVSVIGANVFGAPPVLGPGESVRGAATFHNGQADVVWGAIREAAAAGPAYASISFVKANSGANTSRVISDVEPGDTVLILAYSYNSTPPTLPGTNAYTSPPDGGGFTSGTFATANRACRLAYVASVTDDIHYDPVAKTFDTRSFGGTGRLFSAVFRNCDGVGAISVSGATGTDLTHPSLAVATNGSWVWGVAQRATLVEPGRTGATRTGGQADVNSASQQFHSGGAVTTWGTDVIANGASVIWLAFAMELLPAEI